MINKIRLLLFQELGEWVAQCLEYDIVAQGSTIDEVQNSWTHMFLGHIALSEENKVELMHGVPISPKIYWGKFEEAEKISQKNIVLPTGIIAVEQRVYTK